MSTLAKMLILNDWSVADMGATNVFLEAPLLAVLHTITASHGTQHKFRRMTTAPASGFRAAGDGINNAAGVFENVTQDLDILDATFDWEKALADSHPMGADEVLAKESMPALAQALKNGEKQLLYGASSGVDGASDGFSGLADTLNALDEDMVIASGTPAASQNLTDVWAIRTTDDEKFLSLCLGREGQIDVGERYVQLKDGANSQPRNVYVQPMEAWMGLIQHSNKSAARLCNIDDSDSKLTDDKISSLFELFDEGNPPTHLVMNKRSRRQLQQSRVATSDDGRYAKLPEDWDGIPIITTSSVGYYTTAVPAS